MIQIVTVNDFAALHFHAGIFIDHWVIRMVNGLDEVIRQVFGSNVNILYFTRSAYLRVEFQRIDVQITNQRNMQGHCFRNIHNQVIVLFTQLSFCRKGDGGLGVSVIFICLDENTLAVFAAVRAAAIALVHADGIICQKVQFAAAGYGIDDCIVKPQAATLRDVGLAFAGFDSRSAVHDTDLIEIDIAGCVDVHISAIDDA